MAPDESEPLSPKPGNRARKEGRFARHLRVTKAVTREPKTVIPLLRNLLVETWRSRGGGFYGLGYLIALVLLQLDVFFGDISQSESVSDFAVATLVEYLLRFSVMAFVNAFLALLWPAFVLQHLGEMGIIALVGGYLLFEYALKPVVERFFPELRESASADPDQ